MATKSEQVKTEVEETPLEAKSIEKWFSDKAKKDFFDLFGRMDEDYDLWSMTPSPANLSKYDIEIRAKMKEHTSDIIVVSNDLRANSDNVQSILASASMQIIVRMAEQEGKDKREEVGKLERLFAYSFEKADEKLRRQLLPPLRETLIWHACIRGWVAARILVYSVKKENKVIFDFLPMDPRWLVYEIGSDGLLKVGYKTFKSKSTLKGDWNFDVQKENDNEVIDFWVQKKGGVIGNTVVCDGRFLKKYETLKIPSMPILIMPVATRPPVASKTGTGLKGHGESIFAASRGINAVRNRFATVVANHAQLMADQALINYKTDLGKTVDRTSNVPGGVLELTMGENKLEPSPMKEISPTVVSFLNFLNGEMEQTLLPRIPIDRPPPSGTLYNLAQEAGNKVFNPQLRNLNNIYSDMCILIEEQLKAAELKVEVKSEEGRKYFQTKVTPVDLKKPHIVKVEFTARTPWTQMDTAQIAQMLQQLGLPLGWIWENILKIQDPKLIQDLLALEVYEHSPEGMMKRAVEVLMDRGYTFEAEKLIEQMDMMDAQAQAQTQAQTQGTPGQEALLTPGNQGAGGGI